MKETLAPRGFVTIATGDERYYKLACNLLKSYRLNAKCQYPFAIIAENNNEYTAQFDHTILMENPSRSFNDKLRLFEYLPYEETIFIDADCLIYSDLNIWWERFSEAGDFCAFGFAHDDLDSGRGWFRPSGMREFAPQVSFVPSFNGGVYYMRNTEICRKVFDVARHCATHYSDYAFNMFKKPADEPVLALGMAVNGCRPVYNENSGIVEWLFAPNPNHLDIDILAPRACYHRENGTVSARLIHWSNYLTEKQAYHYEVWKMDNAGNPGGVRSRLVQKAMKLYDVRAFALRVRRYIRRKLNL